MKNSISQKYIKISDSDFSRIRSLRPVDSYLRSLEAYLRKNNRTYDNIDGESYTIYVVDKNDAMTIGFDFNLSKIEYFDGSKLSPLILKVKRKKGNNSKAVIVEDISGNKTTIKKLKEHSFEDVRLNCLETKEIVKRNILTKKAIKEAITKGELTEIKIANKYFINRQELVKFMKSKKV